MERKCVQFKNASINRYAFDVELFTIASIMHLKVQEMPVIMKIDRKFHMKEIVNMFVDVTRICYRHKILHSYQKELAVHLPVNVENNESHYQQDGFAAWRSIIIPPSSVKTSIGKLNGVERSKMQKKGPLTTNKFIGQGILLFIDQILVSVTNWLYWIIVSRLASNLRNWSGNICL